MNGYIRMRSGRYNYLLHVHGNNGFSLCNPPYGTYKCKEGEVLTRETIRKELKKMIEKEEGARK